MKNKYEIIINSGTPFIRIHDEENHTKFGKMFDEFEKVGFTTKLHAPDADRLRFGDPEPFYLNCSLSFHRPGSAMFESSSINSATIIGTIQKFAQLIITKMEQGYTVCNYSTSNEREKLYIIEINEKDVVLKPYQKLAAAK